MPNDFSKEQKVQFDNMLMGFSDNLVLSNLVETYEMTALDAERTNEEIWRPAKYIGLSNDGPDATGNFHDYTQLAVPGRLGFDKHAAFQLTSKQERDPSQFARIMKSTHEQLASDVNVAIMDTASLLGSLVVKRTVAATGYDDIAQADAIMNDIGVSMFDRFQALSTRDYNNMANQQPRLASMDVTKTRSAYEKSFIGEISNFQTHKLDYANILPAAAATSVTINGANQFYTPVARSTATTGEQALVDNRFQDLAVTVGSGLIAVGDCFTVAGVNSVHRQTRRTTGQLSTHRVVALLAGAGATGSIRITPPFISNGGGTDAEAMYQNVTATPADGAAVTFLNTVTTSVNPFWHKEAIELIPGTTGIRGGDDSVAVMRGTTPQGLELVTTKQFQIKPRNWLIRTDIVFGTLMNATDQAGLILFGQT
jgi:hypothetical protein